jgi:hypothetical protein
MRSVSALVPVIGIDVMRLTITLLLASLARVYSQVANEKMRVSQSENPYTLGLSTPRILIQA